MAIYDTLSGTLRRKDHNGVTDCSREVEEPVHRLSDVIPLVGGVGRSRISRRRGVRINEDRPERA